MYLLFFSFLKNDILLKTKRGGNMYIPLKVTTDYSLLKSCIKIEEFIKVLKNNHVPAAGICDNNLFGCMEFYETCQKNGIKPIIGMEIPYNDHLFYFYAKNYEGFQNLLKLSHILIERSLSRIDLEIYKNHLKVIVPFSELETYEEMKEIGFDVFIGYATEYEKNNALIKTNQVVFLKNIRALSEKETYLLDFLTMVEKGQTIRNFTKQNYEKNYYQEENLEEDDFLRLQKFITDFDLVIPKEERYIPHYDPTIEDSFEYLLALTKKGLTKRLSNQVPDSYIKRLKYELNVIKSMGFVDYFLIVYDYVFFAKKNGILVGPGRGSAAGSLVSYSLGITDIDPLKYNLLFERFLNPERITMPDIDIDFEYTKRNQVIEYVKNRYGHDYVAGIMTFGTLEIGRAHV